MKNNISILIVHQNSFSKYEDFENFNILNNICNISINSIIDNIPENINYDLYILDNSIHDKFIYNKKQNIHLHILNNVNKQYFDLQKIQNEYSLKYRNKTFNQLYNEYKNYMSSFRHSYSIQWFINNINKNNIILLCDSDILITNTLNILNDEKIFKYISTGQLQFNLSKNVSQYITQEYRIYPFFQILNIKMMKEFNINFLDIDNPKINDVKIDTWMYDTGSSFLENIRLKELPIYEITNSLICKHFGAGTLNNNIHEKIKWITANSNYL